MSVAASLELPARVRGTISPAIGAIVTAADVEDAARSTIETWQDTYLGELARQHARDPDALPAIRSWNVSAEFSDFPAAQLPSAIVVAPGTAAVERRASGYEATWTLGIAVVVSAATEADTDRLAKLYAAAIRAAIVQHGSLGGIAESTQWTGERFDDVAPDPADAERTLVAAQVTFAVTVADVINPALGILEPPDPPIGRDELPDYRAASADAAMILVRPPATIS